MKQGSQADLRMALGLGASGQVFLEIGLFGHGLGVTFHAVGVLEPGLGMDHVVQALLALFAGQVIVAASAAALGSLMILSTQIPASTPARFTATLCSS